MCLPVLFERRLNLCMRVSWQLHDWQKCLKGCHHCCDGCLTLLFLSDENALLHANVLALPASVDHKNTRRWRTWGPQWVKRETVTAPTLSCRLCLKTFCSSVINFSVVCIFKKKNRNDLSIFISFQQFQRCRLRTSVSPSINKLEPWLFSINNRLSCNKNIITVVKL